MVEWMRGVGASVGVPLPCPVPSSPKQADGG